ncbi:MAG: T9SS type A sorting domain-containing protein [Bacteroidales bacterium]|nr:T9SS type A sorting domain-containing protein [Bacteroidales bacterium]
MRTKLSLIIIMIVSVIIGNSQHIDTKATSTVKAEYMKQIPSIASQIEAGTFIRAENIAKEVNPKRRGANTAVPGKGLPHGNDPLWDLQQKAPKLKGKAPILTFEAASSNVTPTDPTGAVGPNHFVNSWNSAFRIWDKEGNPLTDAASLATIFPGETYGDPIVNYDSFEDRFIIMEFSNTPNGILVAVCQGSDPVNDGWYTYRFNTGSFPDYPKLTLWSDGYYVTANKNSGSAGTSEVVFALERDKMLLGDEDAQMQGFPLPDITTNGFYSPMGFHANGAELPALRNAPIVYMQDDSWSGVSTDHLKIWSINVDWVTTSNSTISSPQIIETEAFDGLFDGGSFSNLPQPSGSDIDALQATIMNMAQYRRFSTYNSVVFNFVVDLDGNDDLSGIRWYELRQTTDGEEWTIYQEGTYAHSDEHSVFSGNMCMDVDGNIALAYTVVSETVYPSLRYTGRFASDPLGQMTIEEDVIVEGDQSDPSTRYGDYSHMTIDPNDDRTFWSIGEYFTSGTRKNQVGVFKIASDFVNDVGIASIDSPESGELSSAEAIVVTIRNYGSASQSNIPVSYQINGGTLVEETYAGTIEGSEEFQYTFNTTADLSTVGESYEIIASTSLVGDENEANNTLVKNVTYFSPIDIGVTEITSPVTGTDLNQYEAITVIVKNFGSQNQSNFDLTYALDGQTEVVEQYTNILVAGTQAPFTFNATGDFSVVGDHELAAWTSIDGDAYPDNNMKEVVITKSLCQPTSDCSSGDGIQILVLGDINNDSGCDPGGYGDYSILSTTLLQKYDYEMTITTGYGNQYIRAWIDFNDNFVFDLEELIIDNYVIAEGSSSGTFTENIPFGIAEDAAMGEHLMRVRANWSDAVPDDPCETFSYGETEDYTINIDNDIAITRNESEESKLSVNYLDNNHFDIRLQTKQVTETLFLTVHDIYGRKLLQNRVMNNNGIYDYQIDMSYASPGLYLIRLGNNTFGKIRKVIVR